jgi:hypothetical protein
MSETAPVAHQESMSEIDDLKDKALAATEGPWEHSRYAVSNALGHTVAADVERGADCEYIAAADPETVLRLIYRLEKAERGLRRIVQLARSEGQVELRHIANVALTPDPQ